jgi:hypothetical protein
MSNADYAARESVYVALDVFEAIDRNPHLSHSEKLAHARAMAASIRRVVGPTPQHNGSPDGGAA